MAAAAVDGNDDPTSPTPETTSIGSYTPPVSPVTDAAEETLLLWSLHQPAIRRQNSFVRHSSLTLHLDSCGRNLTILQSPSSMTAIGVTGAVMWDSGVVLAKFLEHAADSGTLVLRGKRVVELGSGCGLVGCIASLLGGDVILTDLFDRLRLLKKNVEDNAGGGRGSARVMELTWGEGLDAEILEPLPDIDAVLECFLEAALEDFWIGRVDQAQWHPDYRSRRVALFVLTRKV